MFSKSSIRFGAALLALAAVSSCGFKHKKFENPIVADTDQPDKILFDKAVKDIEKGRYEIARITLNTLLNTYESSEFAAKSKLAVADAWYREGGTRGYSQAEAEYKDFILFYPAMEEAAESQKRICDIHMKQMEKPDRDPTQALRAEQECRQLLVQFPNSIFAADAEQSLRNIQEAIAESEFRVGKFYNSRGSYNAAANRLGGVADQFPLFSKADESLWFEGQSYGKLGPAFRAQESDSLVRIVRDYPLSEWVDEAKARLAELEVRPPDADPAAAARMQYDLDNRVKPGVMARTFGFMRRGPDTWTAAKNGAPQMNPPKQNIPPLVPSAGGNAGFTGDVTVAPVTNPQALEQNPDARPQNQQPVDPAKPQPVPAPAKP
ncbi:MAG: outer membrane protein assembly factor BamD [Bryobacteraceae bacterium]